MPKSILDEVHDLESFTEYISDNLSEGTKLNFEVVFRNRQDSDRLWDKLRRMQFWIIITN